MLTKDTAIISLSYVSGNLFLYEKHTCSNYFLFFSVSETFALIVLYNRKYSHAGNFREFREYREIHENFLLANIT